MIKNSTNPKTIGNKLAFQESNLIMSKYYETSQAFSIHTLN